MSGFLNLWPVPGGVHVGGQEPGGELAAHSHAKFDLTSEPVPERRVGGHTGVDDLDGGQLTVFVSAQVNGAKRTGAKVGEDLIAADFPRVWIGEGLKGSPYRDHHLRLGAGQVADTSNRR